MKKIIAITISLVLAFSFCTIAFAEPAGTTPTPHTYKAYKIFTGIQEGDVDYLSRVQWGDGIDAADFLAALKADTTFGNTFDACNTAADVAEILGGGETPWADNSANAMHFAELAYRNKAGNGISVTNGQTDLAAGYYLVVDVTQFGEDETGTVRGLALLQQTKKSTFDIQPKVEAPVVEKKVKDKNDSTDSEFTGWQDAADHDIGDDIPFQLKATLKQISMFDTYKLVFHDTGCAGLDPDTTTFKLYIDDAEITTENAFTVAESGNNFTVTISDVKALGATDNSVVRVEYEAELTEDANIGSMGNPNEVYLEYSNNPNYQAPSQPGGTVEEEMGKTVVDKVIVFTYKVDVNKYEELDGEDVALPGAGFTLYKKAPGEGKTTILGKEVDGNWTSLGEIAAATDRTSFEWKGIDDGEYMLVETTCPNGYARMENLTFTVTATHDVDETDEIAALTLTNLAGGDTFTGEASTGALTGKIYNAAKSATLPETGGIGTKIFYIVGGVMLAGAAILLITKRRMKFEAR